MTFCTYLCCFTYLHTPWCPPAGQSPRGTYQSSALCVGKNQTCTWCRSLCWSRTHSSLSCTLEEEGEKEESHQGLSNPLIWSWSRAKGFGEGGSWKDYTVSPTKKTRRCPVNHFLSGAQVYFRKLVLPDRDFSFIFLFLFRVSESTVWKHNSRDGEELYHADLKLRRHPTVWIQTHTSSHVFN